MSAATSLILVHQDAESGPVDRFDALIDPGSRHTSGAPAYRQLTLPDVVLDLAKLFVLTLQLLLVDPVALYFGHCAFVVEVVNCAVDLGAEVVVVLEELELA